MSLPRLVLTEMVLWADSVSKLWCPNVVCLCVPSRKTRIPMPNVPNGGISRGRVCGCVCWYYWQVKGNRWQVTHNTWPYTWHVTHDMWHMKHDTWHMTHDKWVLFFLPCLFCQMWHLTPVKYVYIYVFSLLLQFAFVSVRFGIGATIRTRW